MTTTQNPTRGGASAAPIILSDQQGFDRRWFASNLQAVYAPTKVADVEACVQDALTRYGKNVKVSSGRHCYENFVYNDQTGAVIDMSGLNQVGFDDDKQAYFIDAGCENWTVYRTLLNTHGKTLPAGSCYSVGAGGHITGGGYGLLSRLHGLTVDHLSAVDIVTWDADTNKATLRTVSKDSDIEEENDLFWALTGAGCGNFGVIVRYWFNELPDAPNYATLYTLSWNWDDVTQEKFCEMLSLYSELVKGMDDNVFALLKLTHEQAGQLGMIVQVASKPGSTYQQHCQYAQSCVQDIQQQFDKILLHSPLLKPLGGHPGFMVSTGLSGTVQHLTYLEALQTLNGSGPNQFGKYKSAYMKKAFPIDQSKTMFNYLTKDVKDACGNKIDLSQCLVQVDSYGGVINDIDSSATAVPQRSSIMKLQYQAYWNNGAQIGEADQSPFKEEAAAYLDWINGFYYEVYKEYGGTPNPANDSSGTVDGAYYNYPDDVLGTHADGKIDEAMWLYFLDNFKNNERNLVEVKRYWDPQNYFHHAQSVPV
jgi:hypothetical protein